MILCLDAGNSRVKFGLRENDHWLVRDALPLHQLEHLRLRLAQQHTPPLRILACSVASAAVQAQIDALGATFGTAVEWLRASAATGGVRNGYAQPEQLGADRWAALIAARARITGACVVVVAGTATTIDTLAADGGHRGGLILPGLALMRAALASGTARLPLTHSGTPELRGSAADNTRDAIVLGSIAATVGAIALACAAQTDATCVLSGGAADELSPHITTPFLHIPDLVLEGLAKWGEQSPRPPFRERG